MGIKIVVANQKGGVGKTDMSVNLGSCLAATGKKVLIMDLDPQASATDYLTATKPKISTSELLLDDGMAIHDIVLNTKIKNLFLAPANPTLTKTSIQLTSDVSMQFKLKRKLDVVKGYDYIFMDTPPSLGALTINALAAANSVLIPIQVHYFAMSGVVKLIKMINTIREEINPRLKIGGVVLTMFDKRNKLSFEVAREVKKAFGSKVFKTMIPINVKLAESPSHHKPIILYSKSCTGAKAYALLAKEFIKA